MIEKLIYNLFEEDDSILVFHNENIRREYLTQYAFKHDTAILQEKALSWDSFVSSLKPPVDKTRVMNPVRRKLFISSYIETHTLQYFISDKIRENYEESVDRFSSYLSQILPSFSYAVQDKRFKESDNISDELKNDVFKIQADYQEFLENNDLIEPSALKPSMSYLDSEQQKKTYYIIAGDTIGECSRFLKQLGNPENIKNIKTSGLPFSPSQTCKIESFDNSLMEIKTTIRRIRYLLNEGVDPSNIAVSVAPFDDYSEEILNEGIRYDVPFVSMQGKSPLNSFAGRFLNGMQKLYDEDFSIDSLKAFLLDPSVPLKERDTARALIMEALEKNVEKGSRKGKENDGYLKKIHKKDLIKYYMTLKLNIVEICSSSTMEKMEKGLFSFQEILLQEGGFAGTESKAVYGFCMAKKEEIKNDLAAMKIEKHKNIFSLWMQYLNSTLYVPQSTEEGIPIYRYPHYSSISTEYHFLIGLNHESSQVIDKPMDFLPGSISESGERGETDLTSCILTDYLTGNTCYPSFSLEDWKAARLPPSFFTEHNLILEGKRDLKEVEDPYTAEALHDTTVPKSEYQASSFREAKDNILSPQEGPSLSSGRILNIPGLNVLYRDELLALSSSKIDSYSKCPFYFFFKHLLKIEKGEYSVTALDRRKLGTFLHSVYQEFYSNVDGVLSEKSIDAYQEKIREIFYRKLEEFRESEGLPYTSYYNIKQKYAEILPNIIRQETEKLEMIKTDYKGLEKALKIKGNGYILEGRIDRVSHYTSSDNQDCYVLIDYKTGSSVPFSSIKNFITGMQSGKLSSYQFPVYRKLLREAEQKNCTVATYYSIDKSKFVFVWNDNEKNTPDCTQVDKMLDETIEKIQEDIEKHNFQALPDKKSCEHCDYRQICRKRYTKG